ncbi:winged helix-turn-helix domain-containing protein [Burkholderia gladioli]|uniref:winged helix-turn-helix domain-containing protein n=1 Tax=Burkholderia gladioli TaxID=28095 RepID=UPI00163F673A|nr:winged helix-turn-helix domain-containing protein [Burkholderia gladioli]
MMGAVLRPRGAAAKRILEMLAAEPLSVREVAERMNIARNSARYHLERLQEERKVHVDIGERRVRRGHMACLFALGGGPEPAANDGCQAKSRRQPMTPVRHEITAALFGEVAAVPLSTYVTHIYQQND